MKKILALLFCLVLVIGTLCACGGEEPADTDSGGDAVAEEDSGDNGEDSEGGAWPENDNTKDVPKPDLDESNITLVFDEGGITSITYKDVSEEQARGYLQALKDSGFTEVESESETAGNIYFGARNTDTDTHMSFNRSPDGTLSLSFDRIGVE